MKKVNYIKNFMLTAILLMSFAFTANAQAGENPKYVCDQNAMITVDLSDDVIGNGFRPDGGKWYKLPTAAEGTYTYNPTTQKVSGYSATDIKKANEVTNIFVVAGKKTGRYDFIFIANNTNACIEVGKHRLATVVVLESPKPVVHSLSLCEGDSPTVDLKTLVSNTLPTPIVFNTLSPASAGTLTGTSIKIAGNFEGEFTLNYSVTHPGAPANFCNASTITINVKRDGAAPKLVGLPVMNYCLNEIPASLNLNSKLTGTVVGGTWTVTKSAASTGGTPTISGATATFATPASGDVYTFRYGWPAGSCYAEGFVTFDVKIVDDLTTVIEDKSITICKADDPNATVDMLRDGLGLSIPQSTGAWNLLNPDENPVDIAVTDGIFKVATATPGPYKYKYIISNASTNLCKAVNQEAILTINVVDINETQDDDAQLCILDVQNPTNAAKTIDLTGRVANLKKPNRTITWTTTATGFTTTAGTITYGELAARGLAVHKFDYSYDAGTCGKATGSLYLTVTDKLDMKDTQEIRYCRDDIKEPIDLTNILGVIMDGTWKITQGAGTSTVTGDKFAENGKQTGDITYKVQFTPTEVDPQKNCEAKSTVITIIISDDKF